MPGALAELNIDGTHVSMEGFPPDLTWQDLGIARDIVTWIQTNSTRLAEEQEGCIDELIEMIGDWTPRSLFSYCGPVQGFDGPVQGLDGPGFPAWYIHICAYRYAIGILIDGLRLREKIWDLYGWGNWDPPQNMRRHNDLEFADTNAGLKEQFKQRLRQVYELLITVVPSGHEVPSTEVEISRLTHTQFNSLSELHEKLVVEEVWSGRVTAWGKPGGRLWKDRL